MRANYVDAEKTECCIPSLAWKDHLALRTTEVHHTVKQSLLKLPLQSAPWGVSQLRETSASNFLLS